MGVTYISKATGNLTALGTWSPVSGVSLAELDSEAGTTTVPQTTPTFSALFTPAATGIDGVAIKVATRPGSTGTITVILKNNTSAGVREGSLAINVSDIDASGLGWYFFKFSGGTVTPNGTDVYKIGISTSSATQVTCYTDGTASNWSRMSRLTSAASAPTTGDKLMMMGEWTAAATLTSFTVTMDDTSATVYGPTVSGGPPQGMTVNKGATFSCGVANLAYTLYWNGVLAVYGGATMNVGTSGTPIPVGASAIYQMNSVANVDSGLSVFPGGTFNAYGNAKWPTSAITGATNATPIEITSTSHGLVAGDRVTISGVGGNTAANGTWEVIASTGANTFTVGAINGAVGGGVGTSTGSGAFTSGGTWQRLAYSRMTADKAAAATTVSVLSTAGWVAGDELCVASTTRTAADCEKKTILTVDSATQVTLTAGLTNAHSGTIPTRAEVGNLTRNVKIRGISASLQGYCFFQTTATVAIANVEFLQLGSATAGKRGIDAQATTGSNTLTYCSFHDYAVTSSVGVFINVGTSANNITVSNGVFYNISSNNFSVGTAVTASPGWIFDANLFILTAGSSQNLVALSDVGGTFTNNTMIGATGLGLIMTESGATIGTFSGNTCHSNAVQGVSVAGFVIGGTISNTLLWRNSAAGILFQSGCNSLTIANPTAFGNASRNFQFATCDNILITTPTSSGDTTFATASGFECSSATTNSQIVFEGGTFGVVSGILTAHATGDVTYGSTGIQGNFTLRNVTLASTTQVSTPNLMSVDSFVRAQRLGGTAGSHKTWTRYGNISVDTTIFDVTPQSVRLTPNNASFKLATDGGSVDQNGAFFVPVASGGTVTVSVRVRKSVVGDGTAYNGNLPRLILRKNVAAGIAADVVLATATAASVGAWETITGTTAAVTENDVLAFVVDCDGTTGWVNASTWTQSGGAGQTGVLATQYWSDGQPAEFGLSAGGAPIIGSAIVRGLGRIA